MTESLLDAKEVDSLVREFGEPRRQLQVMHVASPTYDAWAQRISSGPVACRGEVIMVIVRPNGRVLVHTKDFYPKGIYRLLSGRVLWDDEVRQTLSREVTEETSLDVSVERFLGLIEYEFRCMGKCVPFVSYIFELHERGGRLCCLDRGEGITDFREATVPELSDIAVQLQKLKAGWNDWGQFRAVAHHVVRELLSG